MGARPVICAFCAAIVVACVQGCDALITAALGDQLVPEVHGVLVGAADAESRITWSATGGVAAFVSGGLPRVYRASLGTTESLPGLAGGETWEVQPSADGTEFVTRISPGSVRLHRTSGPVLLTDTATIGRSTGWVGHGARTAPSTALTAFVVRPDRLVTAHSGQPVTTVAAGCAQIIVFSPDETRVLCETPSAMNLVMIALAGGAITPVVVPTDVSAGTRAVRWDTGGIHLLYYDATGRIWRYDARDDARVSVSPPTSGSGGMLAWSTDGGRVAAWSQLCSEATPGEGFWVGGQTCQSFLNVITLSSGTSVRAAVHTTVFAARPGALAFSPTGSTLGYIFDSQLLLVDVH